MKLYVLGVGDTFSEKHVTHALLLEHDGFRLAIDCPDSYRRVLRQARDCIADEGEKKTLDLFAATYHPGSFGRRPPDRARFDELLAALDRVAEAPR